MRTDFYPAKFMEPMMTGAALGFAAQGARALFGVGQAIAGGIMMRKAMRNRPNYEIPQEYMDNVSAADEIMNLRMPRDQYVAQLQGIQRNQTFGLRTLADRRSGLAGVAGLVQQSNDATMRLNAADAEIANRNRVAGTQMKMNARYQLGLQRLAKQQWDKFNPFLARVAQAQGLIGAGTQNIAGAADSAGSLAMMSVGTRGSSPY